MYKANNRAMFSSSWDIDRHYNTAIKIVFANYSVPPPFYFLAKVTDDPHELQVCQTSGFSPMNGVRGEGVSDNPSHHANTVAL